MTPAQAITRLYHLKVDTTTRDGDGAPHEKPHKPLLLLAALDLIDEGLATPDRIPWCQDLRDRFSARFEIVRKLNDRNNPDLPSASSTPPTFMPLKTSGLKSPPSALQRPPPPITAGRFPPWSTHAARTGSRN